MATLVLQAAGAVAGNLIGGPIGALIGQTAGAIAGNVIDRSLLGSIGAQDTYGPRLSGMPLASASEGVPIPRVYGQTRVGGSLIWMTRFEEVVIVQKAGKTGGKGGGATSTTYKYYANIAIGLCEGAIAGVRRIWADGKEIDQSEINLRIYNGDEEQMPDPFIVAKEGVDNAPAYRGLAYAVFERLPLDDYGNRLPLLSFEIIRPVEKLTEKINAVCVIPGSSEFAYDPRGTTQILGSGVTRGENRHQLYRDSDWNASLDTLQALCPNLQSVALVVTWFGDDLRAGTCTIRPSVENATKVTSNEPWTVTGLNRLTATKVSQYEGRPAFGGTPSDDAVIRAVQDLKQRGLKVVFYPFVMMDIQQNNSLQDPWTGAPAQPPYPWRGRITCDPAPDTLGSPDGTPAAEAQVAAFFGSPSPQADEWSFRRFILHYANLCVSAGGVDTFLIGSELAALTRVRSDAGIYPAANHLAQLAADCAVVLDPSTGISYAADWTEYGAHVREGGDEVRFPLDVLWARPEVSFVGIDAYWPLSDWRDGDDHLDASEAAGIYDLTYLTNRVGAGEGLDWYYPDALSRENQVRIPITDGAIGKPWIYRSKDIKGWWENEHYERIGGQELASPTAWSPQSKPIWLTEIGCPAVDKGSNAPNVFPDKKSSESGIPYFSHGYRDDLIQLRTLEATINHFLPTAPEFVEENNPVSPAYGGRMLAHDRVHVWAWDARPYPAFPALIDTWADGLAWETGHWINGRIESVSLSGLVEALIDEVPELDQIEKTFNIGSVATGYIVDRPMSPRSAIEPLSMLYGFDAIVSGNRISFLDRRLARILDITKDDLVAAGQSPLIELTRAQESELSQSVAVTVYDSQNEYRSVTTQSRRLEGLSRRQSHYEIPVVTCLTEARRRADIFLQDMWAGRDTATFSLAPSKLAVEIGDHCALLHDGARRLFRALRIEDGAERFIAARASEPALFDHIPDSTSGNAAQPPAIYGQPSIHLLELAVVRGTTETLQSIAGYADPWPGALAIWRSLGFGTFEFQGLITQPARTGYTIADLGPGPVARYDNSNELVVRLTFGALPGLNESAALDGSFAIAVRGEDGAWEIITYTNAELVDAQTYRLTRLVRGLGGQEYLAARTVNAGAQVVVLDDAITPLLSESSELAVPLVYRIGPARREYSDASYVEVTTSASGLALRPYAPVRPRARRTPAGLELSWVRRSRINGDPWQAVEIPLGENLERYELDILSSGTVVRSISSDTPVIVYLSGDEISDFGAPQSELQFSIYQLSQITGRGFPLTATLSVTQ